MSRRADAGLARLGRAFGGLSVLMGAGGIVIVLLQGDTDLLIDEFVLNFGLLGIGFGSVTWLVMRSQPLNRAVWALCGAAVLNGLYVASEGLRTIVMSNQLGSASLEAFSSLTPASLPTASAVVAYPASWAWLPALGLPLTFGLLLFPEGRLPSRRWRWVGYAAGLLLVASTAAMATVYFPGGTIPYGSEDFEGYGGVAASLQFTFPALMIVSALCAASLIVRYRHGTDVERRQIKWIGLAGSMLLIVLAVGEEASPLWDAGAAFAVALLPASFGVAILKHRLYDIDVVLSKSLTFGALAAFIAAVYVGLVVAIGELIGARSSFGLSVVASVLVAMAFQPVRRRVERWANRLVYGERATPYEVLVRFSRRSAELSDEELLDRIPQMIADGTGAATATLWTCTGDGFVTGSVSPTGTPSRSIDGNSDFADSEADYSLPIVHDGELLGGLSLLKEGGETITPAEEELLADLASGLGLALRNARLTGQLRRQVAELEASRERVLAAADEARRTLENDLDSGPQQQLVALKVKLGPTRKLAERAGAEKTAALLEQLERDAGDAIKAVRDFAGGIYPPLLEAEGLPAAISQEANKAAIPVSVRGDGIDRYTREVEAAVFFAVLEALQNTAKYADATSASVTLEATNGSLDFEVRDDGDGFDPGATADGAGLTGMADRLDTIGGTLRIESIPGDGTTITGSVPVEQPVPA